MAPTHRWCSLPSREAGCPPGRQRRRTTRTSAATGTSHPARDALTLSMIPPSSPVRSPLEVVERPLASGVLGRLRLVDAGHVLGRVTPAASSAAVSSGPGRRRPGRRRPRRPRPRRPARRRRPARAGSEVIGGGSSGSRASIGAGGGAPRDGPLERARPRASASRRRHERSPITSSGPSERLSVRVARTSHTAVQIIAMPTTTRMLASTIVVEPVEPRRGGAPDTSARSWQVQRWWARAPDRRAPADDVAPQLGAVARAHARRRAARRRQRAGVAAAAPQHHRQPAPDRPAAARRPRRRSATRPGGGDRCRPTTAPRRRACCRARRRPPGRAARPSAAPAARRSAAASWRRVSVRASGPRPSTSGSSQTRPSRRGSWNRSRLPSSRRDDPAIPAGVVARRRRTRAARSRRPRRRAAAGRSCRSAARASARP